MKISGTRIDTSAVFDTIHRDKILQIAKEVLSENSARILRILLTDTIIKIKIKDTITTLFTSNIGDPQGDNYRGTQLEL